KPVGELPRIVDDLRVVGVPSHIEESLDRIVGEAFHESRLADRRLPALLDDLSQHPFEVLASRVASRQDVDRVLDGNGAELLEPPPHLDAEIVGLRGQLMDEHEPSLIIEERSRHGRGIEQLLRMSRFNVTNVSYPSARNAPSKHVSARSRMRDELDKSALVSPHLRRTRAAESSDILSKLSSL